jgi:hypothetical protein
MADETVIGEDAAQVGWPGNMMPNRSKASRSNQLAASRRRHRRTPENHRPGENTQREPPVVTHRHQVSRPRKALAFPARTAVGRIIDAAQIDQLLETQIGVIAQLRASPAW